MEHSLHNLQNPLRTGKKRLGRGTKGQNSRSGGGVRPRFEGGHTPLYRLTPKLRGFTSRHAKDAVVSLDELDQNFKSGDKVSLSSVVAKGLVHSSDRGFKVLGDGEISKKLTVYPAGASKNAIAKIEKAGGKVVMPKPKAKGVKPVYDPAAKAKAHAPKGKPAKSGK